MIFPQQDVCCILPRGSCTIPGMGTASQALHPRNKLAGYEVKTSVTQHQAAEAEIMQGTNSVLPMECTLGISLQESCFSSLALTARLLQLNGVVTGKSFSYGRKFLLEINRRLLESLQGSPFMSQNTICDVLPNSC